MTLRVVGSGLGRTGTLSLKLALEQLLGEPCYHMAEVRDHPGHLEMWQRASLGEPIDWHAMFVGYSAVVDWPAAAFWEEISAEFPDALILPSTRADTETWYRSASNTIFRPSVDGQRLFETIWSAMAARTFDGSFRDPQVAMAGYERHNAHVLATAPPERLVLWQPGDGWEPLCGALGLPVPAGPFPYVNTTAEYRARNTTDDES